ncbi:hypothetical protein Plhal304r1_c023g0079671 [Plasmopara halstedii]
MKWSKAAREELVATVANCFRHSGLSAGSLQISAPNIEEQYIEISFPEAPSR